MQITFFRITLLATYVLGLWMTLIPGVYAKKPHHAEALKVHAKKPHHAKPVKVHAKGLKSVKAQTSSQTPKSFKGQFSHKDT